MFPAKVGASTIFACSELNRSWHPSGESIFKLGRQNRNEPVGFAGCTISSNRRALVGSVFNFGRWELFVPLCLLGEVTSCFGTTVQDRNLLCGMACMYYTSFLGTRARRVGALPTPGRAAGRGALSNMCRGGSVRWGAGGCVAFL